MDDDKTTTAPPGMICVQCDEEYPPQETKCEQCGGSLTPVVPDPLIGTTFADRYEILAIVGRGGMSVVYRARQKFMESDVAIKVLNPQLVADPSNLERFTMEAKAANSLKHPNIIQVLDFGITPDSQAFLIMEFLEGRSLGQELEQETYLPIERALPIFVQVCDGLGFAHKKGIVHRDLKVDNIVLIQEPGQRDHVKIVDFGIAKMLAEGGKTVQGLTRDGEVFGSPLYMSPEQCQGSVIDARSDIYSLGCVMYETITGSPPFIGTNSFETMTKHVNEMPLTMRGIAPDMVIPDLLDALVMKTLEKNPDRRPQSMEVLKKDLIDAARRSRILVESGRQGGYSPDPFSVNVEDSGEAAPASASFSEDGSRTGSDASSQATPELQKLVLEAVAITKTQDARHRKMRQLLLVQYGVLSAILFSIVAVLTWPGPAQDSAPGYKKLWWQWQMAQANDAENSGKTAEAESRFEAAARMADEFNDHADRKIKSLSALLNLYQKHRETQKAEQVELRICEADENRIAHELAGSKGSGHIDVRSSIAPKHMGVRAAERYSDKYIEMAEKFLKKGDTASAQLALQKALEIEEITRSADVSDVLNCANKLNEQSRSEEHQRNMRPLLERANRLKEPAHL